MSTKNYGDVSGGNISLGSNNFQTIYVRDGTYTVSLTNSKGEVVYDNKIVTQEGYDRIKADWEHKTECKNKVVDACTSSLKRKGTLGYNLLKQFTKIIPNDGVSNLDKNGTDTRKNVNRSISINSVAVNENTTQKELEQLGVTNCNICTTDNTTQNMVISNGGENS
jgi:hypothetical protein